MSDVKMDAKPSEAKPDKNKSSEGKQPDKDGKDQQPDKQKPLPRWPFVLAGVIVLGFVAVVLTIIFVPTPNVWTDDAYVMVHYATISPRVSGHVTSVAVNDNQEVKAGQLLVTLDPQDYQTSLDMAKAALERDSAQVNNAAANVARQPALISEQEASVASAQAKLGFSQSNQKRYGALAATGAGTAQQRQQADTTLRQDQDSLQGAQASLEAAQRQLEVLKAQKTAMEGTVQGDKAQIEQAELNLSYTNIVAPLDGMVGQRTVQVGNNVTPGSPLMAVVPLDRVYIEANYLETALRHVRGGQHARIHVDAYNIDLNGIVDGVPPSTGAVFSAIPPNNATGNFTKIVQRLPVKILILPDQPEAKLLRAGFSVETTISTDFENVVGEQSNAAGRVTAH